jgi:hypothetical protein
LTYFDDLRKRRVDGVGQRLGAQQLLGCVHLDRIDLK